uniref:Ras-associating domain-containing protein n=1 Tax=Macrostomum lignano TaxID=282301 RepID=A0A1I8FK28_9PLAT
CSCLSEKYLVPSSLASSHSPTCSRNRSPSLIQYPYTTVANKTVQLHRIVVCVDRISTLWLNATVNLTASCNSPTEGQMNTNLPGSMALAQATGILTERQCHKSRAFLADEGYRDSCLNHARLLGPEHAPAVYASFVLLANGNEACTVEKYSYPPEQFWSDVGGVLDSAGFEQSSPAAEFIQLLFLMASKFRRNRSRRQRSARREWRRRPVGKDAWAPKSSLLRHERRAC